MRAYDIQAGRWACYNKKIDESGTSPAVYVKQYDTIEGRLTYWCDTLVAEGYTGVLWKVDAPTGWSGDRYNKDYIVQGGTGMLSMSGETGPSGSYDVYWRVAMDQVTGIANGDDYGLQIAINTGSETGPHFTSDLVIQVANRFK